jgi:hypothetical protein
MLSNRWTFLRRNNLVLIATRLQAWKTRGSNHGKGKYFSFLQNVKTSSGTKSVSYLMGATSFFLPGVKRAGLEFDHAPSSSEAKNEWSCTVTPRVCLHGMYRDNAKVFCPILKADTSFDVDT